MIDLNRARRILGTLTDEDGAPFIPPLLLPVATLEELSTLIFEANNFSAAAAPGAGIQFTFTAATDGIYIFGGQVDHVAAVAAVHRWCLQITPENTLQAVYQECTQLPTGVSSYTWLPRKFFLRKGWSIVLNNAAAYSAGEVPDRLMWVSRIA